MHSAFSRISHWLVPNNEGKKVYITEFIAEEQEFAESKRVAGNEPAGDDFIQMPDGEELPFN